MKVVGYSYDADIHCVDCTIKGFQPYLPESGHRTVEDWLDAEDLPHDSEGNEIHPIFDTDEAGDSPEHCGDCGAYINTSWSGDTVNYATEALVRYIDGWLAGSEHYGHSEVLDIWVDEMQWMILDSADERAIMLYKAIREDEKDAA